MNHDRFRPTAPGSPQRRARGLALILLGALLAAPAFAYTIYLKDGSTLISTEKYTVRGNKAVIKLESGTETVLPLAEIDVERTDRSNQTNLGTAMVIEDGKATAVQIQKVEAARKATLQDLIRSRGANNSGTALPASAEPARRPRADAGATERMSVVGRSPLRDVDLAGTIRAFLFGRGISSVEVLQGNSERRPILAYSTGTEGQVFKAIAASAVTLLHVRDKSPGKVEAFEILCNAPNGGSAGHFVLTPAQAQELVSGQIEMPAFYVRNVLF